MNVMKIVLSLLTTMAMVMITITILTTKQRESERPSADRISEKQQTIPFKRVNRFLATYEDPSRADDGKFHCNKNATVCSTEGSPGSSCCNNKCVDLANDPKYCGACKNKCKHTETCCGGKCVNLSFDKRHCGSCNNKCMTGGYCIYGLCDYA